MSVFGEYTIETPEQVEVKFELAGAGSRFCAILIDWCMIVLILLCVLLVAGLMGLLGLAGWSQGLFEGGGGLRNLASWANAILMLVTFVVVSGYYIFFELIMRGQTPGKRSLKIRTISDDGTPVGAGQVVIRNLLRIVDFLPVFYAVGGLLVMLSATHKRLGDVAAGTIVVKEHDLDYRAMTDRKGTVNHEVLPEAINSNLTVDERRVISGFLRRREQLLLEARQALAKRLAEPMRKKYGSGAADPEVYLEELLQGREDGADRIHS